MTPGADIYPGEPNFTDLYAHMFGAGCHCKGVTFCVTHDCNLRCSYCYERHKGAAHMDFETAKKFVDLLYKADEDESSHGHRLINERDANGIILEFIGGEPLLEIDLIDKTVEYFLTEAIRRNHRWQTRYAVSFSTNGILWFDKRVQTFLQKYQGAISASVTLDGNEALHNSCRVFAGGGGSFKQAEAAFKDSLREGYANGTKLTIAPSNLVYLAEAMINLFSYDGVTNINANPIFEEDWTAEQAAVYYEQLKKLGDWLLGTERYKRQSTSLFQSNIGMPLAETDTNNWCGGTGRMLALDVDGGIYPCIRYLPFSLTNEREPMTIGHVDTGFLSTEEHRARFDKLEAITRQSQSPAECLTCEIARGCAWCSAWHYDKFGTPNKRATGICEMHKARVKANAWYWGELCKKF